MASNYSGVPQGGFQVGVPVQTGAGGPSYGRDYTLPVYDMNGQRVGPNEEIPPGAFVSIGAPAANTGTGGQVLTGTQVPLDASQIAHLAATDKLGVDTLASSNANQAADRVLRATDSATNNQIAFLRYGLDKQQADQQYAIDVTRLGLDGANAAYQQRLGDAQVRLQLAQFGQQNDQFQLSQNQSNAQQRQSVEASRENIIKMLADRTGPQDIVKYAYLLDNLNAPNPDKSTTIDPFAGLKDLYQPSNITPTAAPNIGSLVRDYTPQVNYTPGSGNLSAPTIPQPQQPAPVAQQAPAGGGQVASTPPPPATVQQPNIVPNTGHTADEYSGVPNSQVAGLSPGQWQFVTTGTAGPSNVSDYQGFKVFKDYTTPWDQNTPIGGGTPIFLQKMAMGGMTDAAAIVGDSPSGRPTGHEEIAQALLGPDGQPKLKITPHKKAKKIMKKARMPRAATGGTYGAGLEDPTITVNHYDPSAYAGLPAYQKLTGQRPASSFTGFGASLSNPSLGIYNAPSIINLQRYNQLHPSEQKEIGDVYGTGLQYDINDLLDNAQRAAPIGQRQVATRYGG